MNKHKNKISIILSWTAVLLWLVIIFSFSAQPATESDGLSKKVTKVIIETVDKVVQIDNDKKSTIDLIQKFDHIIRKCAHFTVYIVLGLLMMNALMRSGVKLFNAFLLAIVFCIAYATSDEIHQLFVPGRGPRATDVLIDSAGAFVGSGVYTLIYPRGVKFSKRK
ncbi:VanZ like family protein [Clostridium tepidiprofundi DSM 19306]|uniref:VanZ like family protein n=1 Tax=Clostridium tepidiprofundi DSM 19306 TaxID=1121338 RepID=A0A151B2N6_9CLOT|nr:VanZ family protein [Clostridium tepidiprofundi]KYH34043.1 VanZ like family protein [Clostridium tepidiprofundi DSM 19306]